MVKGLDKFREYFADFSEQYVLIGGAACDISFNEVGADFRATKDLDVVLVVEALTKEFGQQFWEFVREGGYQHRARSNGSPQFYRFEKPENKEFSKMIELFARTDAVLHPNAALIPLHIDDAVSSLSAILLNQEYYQLLMSGRKVIDGVSVLNASYLIPFKAKAWLDLNDKKNAGVHVDSRDIKKHRNDVLRIAAELPLEDRVELPAMIKGDMLLFTELVQGDPLDLKTLGLPNVKLRDLIELLKTIYC